MFRISSIIARVEIHVMDYMEIQLTKWHRWPNLDKFYIIIIIIISISIIIVTLEMNICASNEMKLFFLRY